jgi:hypothetical protein
LYPFSKLVHTVSRVSMVFCKPGLDAAIPLRRQSKKTSGKCI